MRLFAPLPQAVKLGSFSFARVTGPGETFAVRTAVDSLIEFANFSSDIFSDSRVYSNWEPQHIIGKFDNCCRIPNIKSVDRPTRYQGGLRLTYFEAASGRA